MLPLRKVRQIWYIVLKEGVEMVEVVLLVVAVVMSWPVITTLVLAYILRL